MVLRLTNGICSGGDKRRLRATFFARSVAALVPTQKTSPHWVRPVGLTQRHIPRTLSAMRINMKIKY